LSRGPLLRVKLFRVSEDDSLLMITMHHIISDGWSGGILVREFTGLYQAYAKGAVPSLPELKVQYADFAVWQRAWLQGNALETQREYWGRQLAGARIIELPTDHPRGAASHSRGVTLEVRLLPAASAGNLKEVCHRE